VQRWTNAPLLIHESDGRLLTASDIGAPEGADRYVGWDQGRNTPVVMASNPAQQAKADWLLNGEVTVDGPTGAMVCRPVFDHYYALCADWTPERTAEVTGVPADQIRDTARLLWASRPVSYYAWSGVGQHTNATQTDRAISILYSLLGSIGSAGGNQQPVGVPLNDVSVGALRAISITLF
jgi:anaerobic selenocysteine-containing dehydrogenase